MVLYFSGTGNSEYAAKKIADSISSETYDGKYGGKYILPIKLSAEGFKASDLLFAGQQELRNGLNVIALRKQILDHLRQRLRRVFCRVMEQHDTSRLYALLHA